LVGRPASVLGGREIKSLSWEGRWENDLRGTGWEWVPEDIKERYPNDKNGQINTLLGKNRLISDSYLGNAVEVDVDCLS
ncbi:hypothetical protein, partial [Rhizobium johnstonii]|uniref:hypothetical protein n=1 Tax=Rhizobium johnstonii TaxID=3019933 RepID=UPI003F9DD505